MNRKYKFPCSEHYISKGLGPDGKHIFWTKEEYEKMYVPTCADCRESYKRPDNSSLFHPHWWHYRYTLTPWIFGQSHWCASPHWVRGMYQNFGFWKTFKKMFWDRSHYDQYQQLVIPFLRINWVPLEMGDIVYSWIDLSNYYQDKSPDDITQHLIKVAFRYQRMWKRELKEKLNCVEGRDAIKCQFGTWGCKVNHNGVKNGNKI